MRTCICVFVAACLKANIMYITLKKAVNILYYAT